MQLRWPFRVAGDEHERIRADLSAYLDGELTPSEAAEVEAHLVTCEQCRMELASLRATVAMLRAMPEAPAPHTFTIDPASVPAPSRRTHSPLFYRLRNATGAAAALLVALITVNLAGPPVAVLAPAAAPARSIESARSDAGIKAAPGSGPLLGQPPATGQPAAQSATTAGAPQPPAAPDAGPASAAPGPAKASGASASPASRPTPFVAATDTAERDLRPPLGQVANAPSFLVNAAWGLGAVLAMLAFATGVVWLRER